MAHPGGRPTKYSKALADKICSELAEGKSLRTVCQQEGMPDKSTVFCWLRDIQEFQDQYALAKESSAEAMNEILLDLGDEAIELSQTVNEKASSAVVQAVKLKADNLKWVMSKMKPKKYGEKLDLTSKDKEIATPSILYVLHNDGDSKNILPNKKN